MRRADVILACLPRQGPSSDTTRAATILCIDNARLPHPQHHLKNTSKWSVYRSLDDQVHVEKSGALLEEWMN